MIFPAKLFHQDDDFLDTQEGSNHQIRDSSGLIFCKYCDQTFASSGEYSVHLQKHGFYFFSVFIRHLKLWGLYFCDWKELTEIEQHILI